MAAVSSVQHDIATSRTCSHAPRRLPRARMEARQPIDAYLRVSSSRGQGKGRDDLLSELEAPVRGEEHDIGCAHRVRGRKQYPDMIQALQSAPSLYEKVSAAHPRHTRCPEHPASYSAIRRCPSDVSTLLAARRGSQVDDLLPAVQRRNRLRPGRPARSPLA